MKKTMASTMLAVALMCSTCSSIFAEGDKIISKPLVFSDVTSSHWAYVQIGQLYDIGIITGVGPNRFAPNKPTTRAQFVTMLIQLGYQEGALELRKYVKEPAAPYVDVKKSDWFYNDVVDAYNRGLIEETQTFYPNEPITREEMAVMAAKYFSTVTNHELKLTGDAVRGYPFMDQQDGSEAGIHAALYLYNLGFIAGKENSHRNKVFDFKGYLSRAEAAVILMKVYDRYKLDWRSNIHYQMGETTFAVNRSEGKYTITGTLDKQPSDGYSIHISNAEVTGDDVTVHYTIKYPTKVPSDEVGTIVDAYELPAQEGLKFNFTFVEDHGDGYTVLKENGIEFMIAHKQDTLFITADMGERPTTGYAVKIEGIDFAANNTILINYSYELPKPDELQGQMVTHPKDTFSHPVEIGKMYSYRLNLINR
jgi:hypothetical protein